MLLLTKKIGNNGWLKVVSLAVIALALASCGAGKKTVSGGKASTVLQDDIIKYGRQYLGKPYRYAGKGPNSFDCSGYTAFVFKKFGYRLDPSSAGQDRQTPTIAGREELRKGDLVFFEGRRKSGKVGHVGIVTETFSNGHFKFIHSSTSNGVIISSSTEPYYASRYLRGGRVLEENAAYVTRRNPPATKKQPAPYSALASNDSPFPEIPEADAPKREETAESPTAANRACNGNGNVILVQTDPVKNQLLPHRHPVTDGNGPEKGASPPKKSDMTRRDEKEEEENTATPMPTKSHTVRMGETLYSISKQYGCSVEQLKEWNPQMGPILKAGEKILITPR